MELRQEERNLSEMVKQAFKDLPNDPEVKASFKDMLEHIMADEDISNVKRQCIASICQLMGYIKKNAMLEEKANMWAKAVMRTDFYGDERDKKHGASPGLFIPFESLENGDFDDDDEDDLFE